MDKKYQTTKSDEKTAQAHWSQSTNYQDPSQPALPPPPYSQPQSHPQDNTQISQTSKQTGAAAYPPQPHHTQAPSRTFHVGYDGWKSSNIHVRDSDNKTELFKVKSRWKKPHMEIFSTTDGSLIGTSTYHCLTFRIDTTVRNGTEIPLKPSGALGRKGHSYVSPALGGQTMTWKYKKGGFDLPCVDEQGVTIAVFHFQNWSMTGKFELIGPTANDGGPVMEEVLVTGLAFAQYVMAMYLGAITGAAAA